MARPFNQFLHAGERYNDKVIIANFGREFDEKEHKQTRHVGYLVVCKCGYGYVARTYGKMQKELLLTTNIYAHIVKEN